MIYFDDFNYGRRSQPYFFLTIATQLFFFIAYNKMKNIYHTVDKKIVEII
jgi:hypothetical protein